MSEEKKQIKHFNKATVFGRIDGVPTKKQSNEGKARKKSKDDKKASPSRPYWRIKMICASHRGNVLAYGRIWNKDKAEALIDYLKKNPSAGVKMVGFFNQYTKNGEVLSNFTWYDWFPDKCEDPRAAFVLVGKVLSVKEEDALILELSREGNEPEVFEIYALDSDRLKGITEGDIVEAVGYLRSKAPEDEFGRSNNSPIRPYIEELKLKEGDFAPI